MKRNKLNIAMLGADVIYRTKKFGKIIALRFQVEA